jgi:hypothetical protein
MDALKALLTRIVAALPAVGSGAAVILGFWLAAIFFRW